MEKEEGYTEENAEIFGAASLLRTVSGNISVAMKGTSFSTTAARRSVPPIKMKAANTARITPTATGGTLIFLDANTSEKAAPMELDCTIFPIKPRARMINTENRPPRTLPKVPLNAA